VQTQSNLATQSVSLCGQSNLLCTRLCERQDNDEAHPQRVRVGGLVYSTYDFSTSDPHARQACDGGGAQHH
jgi:hypothetical protein